MKDPWKELGMIQAADEDEFSFLDFSLDGTILENKGERYYIWAEKVGTGKKISNLYIARMKTPWKLDTTQVLLTTPDYDWERYGFWVNEGPAVLKHNGKIFVTYSASDTSSAYCMGMLSIDEDADLLDPRAWKKKRYPVLATDAEKGIFGPGHNSFVKGKDGVTDYCVYHARPYEKVEGNPLYDYNRHARIIRVEYDKNGFPIFDYKNLYNE
jgi:GH43 family beta-xylosidase